MGFKSPCWPSVKFGHFGVLECHKDAEDFLLFLAHFAHVPLIHPQMSASIAVSHSASLSCFSRRVRVMGPRRRRTV